MISFEKITFFINLYIVFNFVFVFRLHNYKPFVFPKCIRWLIHVMTCPLNGAVDEVAFLPYLTGTNILSLSLPGCVLFLWCKMSIYTRAYKIRAVFGLCPRLWYVIIMYVPKYKALELLRCLRVSVLVQHVYFIYSSSSGDYAILYCNGDISSIFANFSIRRDLVTVVERQDSNFSIIPWRERLN